nr:hypothetical protein [Lachnospiraceae bacterium]
MKQIKLLAGLELCNLFGLNVIRHTKDPEYKKKVKIFAVIMAVLLAMVLSYIVALCAGLAMLGAADVIPAYLIAISVFFVIFFDIFKVGGVIFRNKGYDIMTAFPVSDGAVVASRFLRLYAESLIATALITLPGLGVYAVTEHPPVLFWLLSVVVTVTIPLLPLSVAVFVGAIITGAAARMKNKAMAEAAFSLILVVGVLGFSTRLSGASDEFSLEMLKEISSLATSALEKIYPPAVIIGNAMVEGNAGACLLFAAVSLAAVVFVIWIVTMNFHAVCRRLYATAAKHDYTIGKMQVTSVRKALVCREARRYFASGPYVSNTIIGPALGAVAAVAMIFVDLEQAASQFPVAVNIPAAAPCLIAAVMSMMNAVCISVSMEGKEWWIVKSLPLTAKMILDGKVLFNLLLIAPFYAVAEISLFIAFKPSVTETVWMILVPFLLIVFSCLFGLMFNLLFPKLDWENETVAVKQSIASFLGGIGGVVVAIIFAFPLLLLPEAYYHGICFSETLLLAGAILLVYRKNIGMNLETI